ncbi:hypothetical protein HPE56_06470 [Maribacter sp. ANRC-HE7]|uniref:Uncharacterized protein n=1 Tax=Maribacter aquimaris TaxID=2737171 RepID=A0ABR7UZC9_9FLAO|nr:hypothetical protein [Maribacter aquimaris]MBD0777430.1 hypothetical protein [Maribacter aquimaris]
MEKTAYYKAFLAQTPEDIIQSVFKNGEDVLVAISLNNGAYLEGVIIDVKQEDNHRKMVCMLSQDEQISFFQAHAITFITVKQPKKMLVELSKGNISRPMPTSDENLSVLQLKRWLNTEKVQLGNQIKELKIDTIPLDTLNNRLNLQDVCKALIIAKRQITKDGLGKEAWQGIETIVVKQADRLQLQIEETTLTISIAVDKALPKPLSKILEEKLLDIV